MLIKDRPINRDPEFIDLPNHYYIVRSSHLSFFSKFACARCAGIVLSHEPYFWYTQHSRKDFVYFRIQVHHTFDFGMPETLRSLHETSEGFFANTGLAEIRLLQHVVSDASK